MYLWIIFFAGIANFAMHRAALESGHPLIEQSRDRFRKYLGPHSNYIIEYLFLVSAMLFAAEGSVMALSFYILYTLMNISSAWFLLKEK